jgi:MscS family membrane protein
MLPHIPRNLIEGIVRVGIAAAVIIIFWLLRRPLRWLLVRIMGWIAYQTKGVRDLNRTEINAKVADIVIVPTNYLAVALGLNFAADILLTSGFSMQVAKLSYTLLSIMFGLLLGRYLNDLVIGRERRINLLGLTIEPPLLPFIHSFVWVLIFFFLLVYNLKGWGLDPTALIAGTGLLGLALSLAAKDTADNMLGYFIIVAERPFLIGDFIRTSDVAGVVEQVGWRSTKVRQADQVLVIVPNKNLTSANIANSQRMAKQQMEIRLNLAYGAPPEAIQAFLDSVRAMLNTRPLVEPDSIVALLMNLGKDALDVLIRCNILEPRWLLFRTEQEAIMLEILHLAERSELEIALPSQKVLVQPLAPASSAESNHKGLPLHTDDEKVENGDRYNEAKNAQSLDSPPA